ncbi:MAG: methionyl-tRNA formyltransferase [bacterium]
MRVVFCGTPDIAVPSLESIAAHDAFDVLAVLTQPDRPAGRGRAPRESPVKEAAKRLGLRVESPDRVRDVRPWLEELAPDAMVVVAYGHIFRRWLLELPRYGCVNAHFSLLPRHRGVAPVQWAILDGDRETGVTTMKMDRGVDTGPTLLEERVTIGAEETAGELLARLAPIAGGLLVRTLDGLARGTLEASPQSEEGATYARKLEKEDGRVDWSRPAAEIARQVRGLSPWPGAFTTFRGAGLKLHEVRVAPASGSSEPGRLVHDAGRILAETGSGRLELLCIQAEGKARLPAEAWWRGARPEARERLGREVL